MFKVNLKKYNKYGIYTLILAFLVCLSYNIGSSYDKNALNSNAISIVSNDEFKVNLEEIDLDEFLQFDNSGKVLSLSNQTFKTGGQISDTYIEEYNRLKNAVLNHESKYIFNAGRVSKSYYATFVKEIWSSLRSEKNISQNVIFKTVKADGFLKDGYYENVKINFSFDYNVNKSQEDVYKNQIKAIANSFKNLDTDYKKAQAINEYLLQNADYAFDEYNKGIKTLEDGMSIHSPYTILAHKKGVCTAFAELFNLIANEIGLETKVVTGEAFSFGKWGNHAWNVVKIDGKWYHCDSSWNKTTGNKYFSIGNNTMSVDHKWNPDTLPSMSELDHNQIKIYNY